MKLKKTIGMLVLAVTLLAPTLQAFAATQLITINDAGGVTPPEPQSYSITVGDCLELRVHHDNFIWEDDDEEEVSGAGIQFTAQMITRLGLTAHLGQSSAYFDAPRLEIRNGALFIIAQAVQPSENIPFPVCIMSKNGKLGPVFQKTVTIARASGSGEEGPGDANEPGGGNESGNGNESGDEGETGGGNEAGSEGETGNGSASGESSPQTTQGLRITGLGSSDSLALLVEDAIGANLQMQAGDSIWIPLNAGAFLWADNGGVQVQPDASAGITLAQIHQAGLKIKPLSGEMASVVQEAAFAESGGAAGIRLVLAQTILSLEDVSFSVLLQVSHNGITRQATASGTVRMRVVHADSGTRQISLQDGVVVEAGETLRALELYLGDGVTLRTALRQGERICGVAVREAGSSEMDGIDTVCSLYLLGPRDSGSVTIANETLRYVYDTNEEYLGTTGSELLYRSVYYISTAAPRSGSTFSSGSASSGGEYRAVAYGSPESFYEMGKATPDSSGYSHQTVNDNPNTGH